MDVGGIQGALPEEGGSLAAGGQCCLLQEATRPAGRDAPAPALLQLPSLQTVQRRAGAGSLGTHRLLLPVSALQWCLFNI